MAATWLRTAFLKVHLWVGMSGALFLFALGLSGALLTFEDIIDPALNAKAWYVKPQGTPLKMAQITQAIHQAFPQSTIEELVLPQTPDETAKVVLRHSNGREVGIGVNPYTGEIVGRSSEQQFRPMLMIRQFHTHLLIRRQTGHAIQTIAACCLLGLAVTGMVLWWPRKIFKLRGARSRNLVFDLHQMLGLWSSACVLLFAVTGVAIQFEDQVDRWASAVSHIPPATWPQPNPPAAGVPPLSPDELLARAESIAPGARTIVLDFGDSPNDPVLVIMKFPEDHLGRTHVILDRYTGEVLRFDNTRSMPVALKYARLWNQEIHTGEIFGWPTRILACIFSLAVAALAVTGPWIWWNRNRGRPALP
ncbi:MAG TPA: PepSY-associated TM helix domain-containing protein [Candidatus Sulfotelmatobacter sp.]|nr:PepSY-associated TM helix domain-containing protein [Candidatus Sulfotelmatobacter sp.]